MNIARRLLLLNGVAILAVILFHASGWGLVGMFTWAGRHMPAGADPASQAGTGSYFVIRAIEQLTSFAVAAFIFVSGFFIAVSADRRTRRLGWGTIGRRVIGLLIPYLVWTSLLMGLRFLEGKPWSLGEVARGLLTGATNPAYYFVPLLIQLYLLAPLLVPLVFTRPRVLLVATAVLELAIYLALYTDVMAVGDGATPVGLARLFPKWFFPSRLFWFILGITLGLHLPRWQPTLTRLRYVLLAGIVVFAVVGMVEWELLLVAAGTPMIGSTETIIDGLFSASVILAFIAWSRIRLPAPGVVLYLGLHSFGIYLVHSPAMELAARLTYHFTPQLLGRPVLVVLITTAAGLSAPILLMAAVKRSHLKRAYPYLFG
jgi:peptidoglycan/LPS O-acetylase OafA/YrhL